MKKIYCRHTRTSEPPSLLFSKVQSLEILYAESIGKKLVVVLVVVGHLRA